MGGTINWGIFKRHFWGELLRHQHFMSGYAGAGAAVNDPFAIWSRETLARVSNRLTMTLMGILLCAVMALYLAASSIEVHQRPVAKSENQLRIV